MDHMNTKIDETIMVTITLEEYRYLVRECAVLTNYNMLLNDRVTELEQKIEVEKLKR